jgi:hypothetical protein
LYTLIDVGFVKDIPELVEHCQGYRSAHLLQMLSDFAGQADRNLNTIVRGLME